ncbi:MAG: hypothetical protein U0Q16_26215 [Bryobacteraceae bacterium]
MAFAQVGFHYEALASDANGSIFGPPAMQVMPGLDGIVEWYKSTGLHLCLDRITDASQRQSFLDQYRERVASFFPESKAGGVSFQFRRLFVVACA